jgi:membrane associated rhomboid family serine protease
MFLIFPWDLKHASIKGGPPLTNLALIACNVLVFLLGWHWTVGPGSTLMSIVLYGFSHVSWWHLVVNMWALWVFGNPLNRRIGAGYYLLAYLGTIVLVGLVAWFFLDSNLSGASGAIYAVIIMVLILIPAAVLRVACVALFPLTILVGLLARPRHWFEWLIRAALIPVPALWCLALIPLLELVSLCWPCWNWAAMAHLLGMLCGAGAVLLLPTRISMPRGVGAIR